MDEQFPKEVLEALLNNENGIIPELADLPSWWRKIPPEQPSSRNPQYSARDELLGSYINWAHTKQSARDGLLGLLREFLNHREPVPELLNWWVQQRYALGPPAPIRGPRENEDRNFRVYMGFKMLRNHGYSREAAFNLIADHLVCAPETVRSIVRKWETERPFRRPR